MLYRSLTVALLIALLTGPGVSLTTQEGITPKTPGKVSIFSESPGLLACEGAGCDPSTRHLPAVAVDTPRVVQIPFDSRAALALLASRIDIWEVTYTDTTAGSGVLIAGITPADEAWLFAQGIAYSPHVLAAPLPNTIIDYPCYRTVDELHTQLEAWAAAYPALTELRSIGDSYEGRPLLALRLTNEATGLNKPVFFLMANIHGRELITPEVAMQFIARLLDGYSTDPDVTWVLDHQIVEVLVSANPDGHVKNEGGQRWAYWRKNTNPSYGFCGGTSYGVDLNRNSTWHWGGPGASSYSCDLTYRGPTAGSEVETQAVEDFLRDLYPDERPFDTTTPAPADKDGLFITLHSYSNLVLWPWGDSYMPAPNAPALARLGAKLATYTGYTAQQSSDLYTTSGATDDFAYGELGVAAYTFEIGSPADGFYPTCSRYEALVAPNLDALFYAAKVTRAPYLLPAGPDALALTTTAGVAGFAPVVTVTARIDDSTNGNRPIAAAELYIDTPPWLEGAPYAMGPADGGFNQQIEQARGAIPVDALASGHHLIYVRGQDIDGAWGPVSSAFLTVTFGLSLTPSTVRHFALPNTTISQTLTLTNTGTVHQTVVLTATGATWPTTLTPTWTLLAPGSTVPVTLKVTVPADVTKLDTDTVTVRATSDQYPLSTITTTVQVYTLWHIYLLPFIQKGR